MNIYPATQKGPLKIPGFIDPDDVTNVQVYWGAPIFATNTVYRVDDIVRPTTENGYYYKCTTSGIAGGSEPTWTQTTVTSGTAVFTAVSYDLYVLPSQTIATSTWTASNSVTIAGSTNTAVITSTTITVIPDGVTEFTLTNQVVKSNGESLSRTFKYKVREQ